MALCRGEFGTLRDAFLSILAEVEASIDFPEEDLGAWPREEMGKEMEEMGSQLRRLILSFREGRIVRGGSRYRPGGSGQCRQIEPLQFSPQQETGPS